MTWLRSIAFLFLAGTVKVVLLSPAPAHPQVIDDTGVWLAFFARGDIGHNESTDRFKWWFDAHARFFDDADGFGQSIARPGIGYALGETATVWAGYGWIHSSPGANPDFDEHRAWQQLTWSNKLSRVSLSFRPRLEQRFLETGSDTGWRFRQLVGARRALECSAHVTLVAWDEIFFHLNDTDWGANSGFNQNRLFLGLGFKRDPASPFRVEAGYLNQYVDRSTRDDVSNHLLSVNFYWTP